MTTQEFYLLYDTIRSFDPEIDFAGGLTEAACAELYDLLT